MTVGPLYALAAAALFGLSTPAAKLLVGAIDPWALAGLLYLGSGIGLAALRWARLRSGAAADTPLARADWPWLGGAIAAGGVLAPILLMIGLTATPGATASLLLTVEGVATALIAWFAFRENFDRRIAIGMVCIVSGAAVLAWPDEFSSTALLGPVAVLGACVAWGIDNNLTRKVALADPIQIAMVKGLIAGSVNLALAASVGAPWPPAGAAVAAGAVGFLGYGVSLALFVLGLRHLGTARTGAYFSTAPFVGAVAAWPLLGESPSAALLVAGGMMAIGVWLHLTERHEHDHEHDSTTHAHSHVHDDHHRHDHAPDHPPGEPHAHPHAHGPLRHAHAHAPDAYHRHDH